MSENTAGAGPTFIKDDKHKERYDLFDPQQLRELLRDEFGPSEEARCGWAAVVAATHFWAREWTAGGLTIHHWGLLQDNPGLLAETHLVLEFGVKKYAAWNWSLPCPWWRYYNAIIRHARKIAAGETLDAETGLSHLAAISCNLMFLIWHARNRPEGDTRRPV